MDKEIKITCPKCNWEPDGGEYWACDCGHQWNTFDTAGRCPSCGKQWEQTQCVVHHGGCTEWSPHIDWYDGLDEWLREQLETVGQEIEV